MAVVTRNCIVSFIVRAIFFINDQPNAVGTVTELLIFVIQTCLSSTKHLTLRYWREIILEGTKNSEGRSSTPMVRRTPCVGFQIMVLSLR
jgi:hypothetical protein